LRKERRGGGQRKNHSQENDGLESHEQTSPASKHRVRNPVNTAERQVVTHFEGLARVFSENGGKEDLPCARNGS